MEKEKILEACIKELEGCSGFLCFIVSDKDENSKHGTTISANVSLKMSLWLLARHLLRIVKVEEDLGAALVTDFCSYIMEELKTLNATQKTPTENDESMH